MLPKIIGDYKNNYNLKHLTWFKVGGNADIFVKPHNIDDLVCLLQQNKQRLPITVIGAGSNIIIRDGGIEGIVIKLGRNFTDIKVTEDNLISVGSSCLNYNLAKFCQVNSLANLEFLIGIPGTIGGGVTMNAGAYGSEFKDIIVFIEAVNQEGKILTFSNKEIGFKYRGNHLQKDIIVTKAIFKAQKGDAKVIQQKMEEINNMRLLTQPIKERTGGSTFANPEGYKAWKLIDEAGMRGYRVNEASMSELHCNFMINHGNACARDLEDLGNIVQQKVFENSGVKLKWEIKCIGRHE